MARLISTTVRLEEEDIRALRRARAAGHSASALIPRVCGSSHPATTPVVARPRRGSSSRRTTSSATNPSSFEISRVEPADHRRHRWTPPRPRRHERRQGELSRVRGRPHVRESGDRARTGACRGGLLSSRQPSRHAEARRRDLHRGTRYEYELPYPPIPLSRPRARRQIWAAQPRVGRWRRSSRSPSDEHHRVLDDGSPRSRRGPVCLRLAGRSSCCPEGVDAWRIARRSCSTTSPSCSRRSARGGGGGSEKKPAVFYVRGQPFPDLHLGEGGGARPISRGGRAGCGTTCRDPSRQRGDEPSFASCACVMAKK